MLANVFHKLLLLVAYQHISNGAEWNYKQHGKDWTDLCSSGKMQSPLSLNTKNARVVNIPKIVFGNYNQQLKGPIHIYNNGHSLYMSISYTVNGKKPFITGGLMKNAYDAIGLHFHWGAPREAGSEHALNRKQYAGEMHIVHRNNKYNSTEDAVTKSNGIAVLGVFLGMTKKHTDKSAAIARIIKAALKVTVDRANTTIPAGFSLGQLIGSINHNDFLTYHGSLTTPLCQEAVTWTVFTQVMPVPFPSLLPLYGIRDHENHKLLRNYRQVQNLNGRTVYHRKGPR
ncbi:putative carbonic anhydrase 3 [Drosophila eugracilis]|uniref:putative carbonic anhydrase 3 n=1 Tax=Drosophila eugracilis TaxID=29029 RepID=UPI0007E63086|nr:putative carbonic anhydrase 3 [Drosophila eugracilis]